MRFRCSSCIVCQKEWWVGVLQSSYGEGNCYYQGGPSPVIPPPTYVAPLPRKNRGFLKGFIPGWCSAENFRKISCINHEGSVHPKPLDDMTWICRWWNLNNVPRSTQYIQANNISVFELLLYMFGYIVKFSTIASTRLQYM